jgi:hypothetical protein
MGLAASQFFSSDSSKETLHRRIVPTDEQYEEQITRWNELAEALVADLGADTGLSLSTWLQGSYKFGTQIRPVHLGGEFDIDLGLYFRWAGLRDHGDFGPGELKSKVQSALEAYGSSRSEVLEVVSPPKKRCCRIRFSGDFHIDVPTYHLRTDKEERSLATEDDDWEDSDPKALYVHFRDRFEQADRDKVRRHIRYLKTWAALKFGEEHRPSSVLLTVLVADAAEELYEDDLKSDDTGLHSLVQKINERLARSHVVLNPVNSFEDLAARLSREDFEAFQEALSVFETTAGDAVAADDAIQAADKWTELFEHLFPLPDVEEALVEGVALAKSLGAPAVIAPYVSVVARLDANPAQSWSDINKIGPIPRDCTVTFQVLNSGHFPFGTTFHWTVRNGAGEAEEINDLGHVAGRGEVVERHTEYNGHHHMDCVAKVNGRTISIRRIPVEVRAPLRVLRQKPTMRRFRIPGRR